MTVHGRRVAAGIRIGASIASIRRLTSGSRAEWVCCVRAVIARGLLVSAAKQIPACVGLLVAASTFQGLSPPNIHEKNTPTKSDDEYTKGNENGD
jgi:hypothetical protein